MTLSLVLGKQVMRMVCVCAFACVRERRKRGGDIPLGNNYVQW